MATERKYTKRIKPKVVTNYIAIALDTLGSMGVISENVRLAYNDMLKTIRERSVAENQQTFVSLVIGNSHLYRP
ncbi:MAG: hypothetical protein C0467_26220 [Planctomycetaceae bacterium]|nr:hypothetical protein [Planctomycetaceae bacterium]